MVGRSAVSGERAAVKRGAARRRAGLAVLLLSTTALTGPVEPARADDTTWDGSTNSNWFDSSNWDTNAVPTAGDLAITTNAGPTPIVGGPGAVANGVTVGDGVTSGLFVLGNTAVLTSGNGLFIGGNAGTGTISVHNGGDLVVTAGSTLLGNNNLSTGTLTVTGAGSLFQAAGSVLVGNDGTGNFTLSAGATATMGGFGVGVNPNGTGTALVTGAGSQLTAQSITVGSFGDGTFTLADGANATVTAALIVGQNAGSNGTLNLTGGSNMCVGGVCGGDVLIATQAGATGTINIGNGGAADTLFSGTIQFGAGAGTLNFNHTSTNYSIFAAISGTGTINHFAGATKLTGDNSAFAGTTNITGGELYVNNILGGLTVVNSAGTLGGSGTLNQVALGAGGTIAPGNSIGILSVATLNIESGSTYEVELNDGGFSASVNNDTIGASGAVTINGGTVHVTPENGMDTGSTYTPGTYTILTSAVGITGAFDAVTDDFAFLDFTLEYPNINNVFLNSSLVTSFCLTDMTANQCATADGVFSLGTGSLLTAVVNLSDAEAPGALDQLSGEIHASARTALIEDSRFVREAALSRLDAAFSPIAQGDGPGQDGVAFWGRAFGSFGDWDGDGNAAGLDRHIGGFFLGGDALVTDDIRLGLMGGYSRSSFDVDGRASSGDADTWSVGAYAGGEWNAFSLKGGAAYSWHNVETERSVAFTGFSDDLSASYDARTAQVYGEAAYAFDAGPARFEPFANLAHVSLSTDSFAEAGGEAALTSPGDVASATFTTLGLRAETSVVLDEVDVTLSGMLGWRHGFGDTPTATLGFTAGGEAFTVAGVPIARDSLVVEAGFDVALGKNARLSLSYDGQFGSGLYDHSAKARFGIDF